MVADTFLGPLATLAHLRGLFLSGSHARGTADAFSDLDLVLVVQALDHAAVVQQARAVLAAIAPVVLFRERKGAETTLVNVIMSDWTRIDLLLEVQAVFQRRDWGSVKAVHDPAQLGSTLQSVLADRAAPARQVIWATEEFLRVLGLLAVALGRGEWVLGTMGAGLLRDQLITVMKAESGTLGEGALHLSRSVTANDMAVLTALPVPAPDRDSVIAAHLALARAFIPRARAFHAAQGLPWPTVFEAATKAHLAQALQTEPAAMW